MKPSNGPEPISWRARLHSLPPATEPAPRIYAWIFGIFQCVVLFLFGAFLFLLPVALIYPPSAIGHEYSDSRIYPMVGLTLNPLAATAIAFLAARRSGSKAKARLAFYSFTAPFFLAFIIVVISVLHAAHAPIR